MEFALGISVNSWSSVCAIAKKAVQYGRSVSQPVSELSLSIKTELLLIDSDDAAAAAVQSINCRHCRVPLLAAVVLFPLFLLLSFFSGFSRRNSACFLSSHLSSATQSVSQSFKSSSLNLPNTPLPQPQQHSTQWEWSDRQRKEGDRGDLSPTLRAAGKANKAKKRTTKNEEEEIARNIRPSLQLRWEEGVAVARRQLEWHKEPVRHYSFIQSVSEMERFNGLCLLSQSIVSLVRLAVYRVLCVCVTAAAAHFRFQSQPQHSHKPLWTKAKK